MKKFLIGCGIFVLVAIVIVCGCSLYVGAKGVKWVQNVQVAVEKTAALEADYPFTASELGTDVDPARFQDYLAIRQDIIDRTLRIALVAKITQAQAGGTKPSVGMGDVFGLMSELPTLIGDYETILRTEEMPPSEYRYYVRVVLKSIKDGSDQGDQDFQPVWSKMSGEVDSIQAAIDQHNSTQPPQQQIRIDLNEVMSEIDSTPASPTNIEIVRQHLDTFSQNPEMIWLEIILTTVISETLPQMVQGR